MSRRLRLRLIVLLAFSAGWPLGGLAAGDGGGERPTAPIVPPETASTPWTQMVVAGGEVHLAYPADLALAVTPEQLLTRSTIPACDQPFDYCLYLPSALFEGTNLSSAGLRISRRPDLTAEISCLLAQPEGYSDLQPAVVRGQPASTSRFGDLGQGAAGSYSLGELRRLWSGQACYEFETRQVLTRYENYDPGAITQFTTADQADLATRFRSVLRSVTLAERQPVTWPTTGTSTLDAFVQPAEPAPGASVGSPLRLAGQAVGNWFFEGTFPVRIVGANGEELASGYVTADGPWMTTRFVAYKGALPFSVTEPTRATLILQRANPSALAVHDASVRVPLTLLPDDAIAR